MAVHQALLVDPRGLVVADTEGVVAASVAHRQAVVGRTTAAVPARPLACGAAR